MAGNKMPAILYLYTFLIFMKSISFLVAFTLVLSACQKQDRFNPDVYFSRSEKDSVLTGILSHILLPPPYVKGVDRIRPIHHSFYRTLILKYELDKVFLSDSGTYYYLLFRPGNKPDELRGVGGSFKMNSDFTLSEFREIFVTPILPAAETRKRGEFLFSELSSGNIKPYLKMKSYVEWPNEISYYDTLNFEWRWRKELIGTEPSDTLR